VTRGARKTSIWQMKSRKGDDKSTFLIDMTAVPKNTLLLQS